jgi:hypothetical protein
MSPVRFRRPAVLLAAASLFLPQRAFAAETPQRLPYATALVVRWGAGAGSDAFRDDLERSAAANLATKCFADVVVPTEGQTRPTELTLTVELSDVLDETRYDGSIASTLQPDGPAEVNSMAEFTVTVDARLTVTATGAYVTGKRFHAHSVKRPMFVGEDAQEVARAHAIRDAVADLAKGLGCGKAKLDKNIREAMQAGGGEPHAR